MGITKKHVPGCSCCGGFCLQGDLDGTFTEESGTWVGNSTSDDYAQKILDPLASDFTDHFHMQHVKAGADTHRRRNIFSWVDVDNYWFAEYYRSVAGGMTVRIGNVVAGTESILVSAVNLSTGDLGLNCVCFTNGVIAAFSRRATPSSALNVRVYVEYEATPPVGQFGFGSGDITGTLDFAFGSPSSWLVQIGSESPCIRCPRDCCDGLAFPMSVDIVLASLPSPYDVWDGTYTIDADELPYESVDYCKWEEITGATQLANPDGARLGTQDRITIIRDGTSISVTLYYEWSTGLPVTITGTGTTTGTYTTSPCNDDWGGNIALASPGDPGTANITGNI